MPSFSKTLSSLFFLTLIAHTSANAQDWTTIFRTSPREPVRGIPAPRFVYEVDRNTLHQIEDGSVILDMKYYSPYADSYMHVPVTIDCDEGIVTRRALARNTGNWFEYIHFRQDNNQWFDIYDIEAGYRKTHSLGKQYDEDEDGLNETLYKLACSR